MEVGIDKEALYKNVSTNHIDSYGFWLSVYQVSGNRYYDNAIVNIMILEGKLVKVVK